MKKNILAFILLLLVSSAYGVDYSNLELAFVITPDGDVSIERASIKDVSSVPISDTETDYSVEFYDNENNLIDKAYFSPKFSEHDSYGEIIVFDSAYIYIQKPYSIDIKNFKIKLENKILLEDALGKYFCDNNGICEEIESYEYCLSDCPSGSNDDFCDNIQDDVCDPDCQLLDNEDCKRDTERGNSGALSKLILYSIILIIAIITVYLLYNYFRYKKNEQNEQ